MGNQLDVLIGHPEHDLLFIATQVARVAGLKNAHSSVGNYKRLTMNKGIEWASLGSLGISLQDSCRGFHQALPNTTALFTEGQAYQMLLRGHAPASEPFRKWVTEEVLPSIRKTGSYDIGTSTTPEAQQLSMDYGDLRALIENMAI